MSVAKFLSPLHLLVVVLKFPCHMQRSMARPWPGCWECEARQEWERRFLPSTFAILHCTGYVLFVIRSFCDSHRTANSWHADASQATPRRQRESSGVGSNMLEASPLTAASRSKGATAPSLKASRLAATDGSTTSSRVMGKTQGKEATSLCRNFPPRGQVLGTYGPGIPKQGSQSRELTRPPPSSQSTIAESASSKVQTTVPSIPSIKWIPSSSSIFIIHHHHHRPGLLTQTQLCSP
jgi:hypothetical protein